MCRQVIQSVAIRTIAARLAYGRSTLLGYLTRLVPVPSRPVPSRRRLKYRLQFLSNGVVKCLDNC